MKTWKKNFQCDQKYILINKYKIVIYKLYLSQCFPAFKTNQQYLIFVTLKNYVSMLKKKNLIYRVLPA
jgi:hypothetical protein